MSTQGETLCHPVNGSSEQTWDGFSWPGFFLGLFWLLFKGLYGPAVITLLALIVFGGVTSGVGLVLAAPISWLVIAIMGNGWHKNKLIRAGYMTRKQWDARHQEATPPPAADERTCPFCAEQIKRAALVCKHCGRDVPQQAAA